MTTAAEAIGAASNCTHTHTHTHTHTRYVTGGQSGRPTTAEASLAALRKPRCLLPHLLRPAKRPRNRKKPGKFVVDRPCNVEKRWHLRLENQARASSKRWHSSRPSPCSSRSEGFRWNEGCGRLTSGDWRVLGPAEPGGKAERLHGKVWRIYLGHRDGVPDQQMVPSLS